MYKKLKIRPKFLWWLSFVLIIFFIPWTILLAFPGSPLFSLGAAVAYVTFISHVAIIYAALSTLQASQVEIHQEEDANVEEVKEEVKKLQ